MTSVVEIQPTVAAPAHGQVHDPADDRARRQAQDLRPVLALSQTPPSSRVQPNLASTNT